MTDRRAKPVEVPRRRSPRLRGFDYTPTFAYSITVCTRERTPHFADGALGREVGECIEDHARQCGYPLLSVAEVRLTSRQQRFVRGERSRACRDHASAGPSPRALPRGANRRPSRTLPTDCAFLHGVHLSYATHSSRVLHHARPRAYPDGPEQWAERHAPAAVHPTVQKRGHTAPPEVWTGTADLATKLLRSRPPKG